MNVLGRTSKTGRICAPAAALLACLLVGWPAGLEASTRTEDAKLTASDGGFEDNYGSSIAASGEWVVVGSPWHDIGGAAKAGSAYVYHDGGAWNEHQVLSLPVPASDGHFGISVAIDGDRLAIGATGVDDYTGAVYVYQHDGTDWVREATLRAPDGAVSRHFGRAVAISDGTVVVGDAPELGPGSAYVFHDDEGWAHQQTLTSPIGEWDLGVSVAVEGNVLVAGDDWATGPGEAYVFERSGGTWGHQATLAASDGATGDEFGGSLAIHGQTIVVGAEKDADGGEASGSAYVFRREGGSWTQEAKLTALDANAGALFGCSVSVSGDRIVVGAQGADHKGSSPGAAYAFRRVPAGWIERDRLVASDATDEDQLGVTVAIDGELAVAGAPGQEGESVNSGAAYVYELSDPAATYWQREPSFGPGDWLDHRNWTASFPLAATDAHVENGGTARIGPSRVEVHAVFVGAAGAGRLEIGPGATAALGDLNLGAAGEIAMDAAAELGLAGDLNNHSTRRQECDLASGTVRLQGTGPQRLEAAGENLGATAAGWVDNFAVGSLIIEPGSIACLTDTFDNCLDGNGNEAVYADVLVIEPGGWIDLGGIDLYYRNGGDAKQLFYADTDLDGDVDWQDYLTLAGNFGKLTGLAGWMDGDTDGDLDVDWRDYVTLKRNFGLATVAPPAVPEPSAAALLGLCVAGALARRRKR